MTRKELIKQICNDKNNGRDIIIPDEYRNDCAVALAMARVNGGMLSKFDSCVYKNKKVIVKALKSNPASVKYVPDELYDNKKIVMMVVGINGHLLWKASDRLTDNLKVVLAAINNDVDSVRFASKRLRNHKKVLELVEKKKREKDLDKEKKKQSLQDKILKEKDYSIWWNDKGIENNEKLSNSISDELIIMIENKMNCKLPSSYIELLKKQNGGRLKGRYCSCDIGIIRIDAILGISFNDESGMYYENMLHREYIPEGLIIFGNDESGGHAHFVFDYTDFNDNGEPKIAYYDNELGEKYFVSENFSMFLSELMTESEVEILKL